MLTLYLERKRNNMKNKVKSIATITVCVGLFAAVWALQPKGEDTPAASAAPNVGVQIAADAPAPEKIPLYADGTLLEAAPTQNIYPSAVSMRKEGRTALSPAAAEPTSAPETLSTKSSGSSADPYHTDVYPENVYLEECFYDADGNLIGKTTTIPTAFGPDTIWFDGHAYYDVPGFGLVERSGTSQRTEDYTMYESGVKIGSMGGEDEPNTPSPAPALPEPTGEVIDQTINTRPEKNSTPPDYKPETTPPAN